MAPKPGGCGDYYSTCGTLEVDCFVYWDTGLSQPASNANLSDGVYCYVTNNLGKITSKTVCPTPEPSYYYYTANTYQCPDCVTNLGTTYLRSSVAKSIGIFYTNDSVFVYEITGTDLGPGYDEDITSAVSNPVCTVLCSV